MSGDVLQQAREFVEQAEKYERWTSQGMTEYVMGEPALTFARALVAQSESAETSACGAGQASMMLEAGANERAIASAERMRAREPKGSPSAAAATIDELHKMLDEAEISRKRSMDAGATWQEYTMADRLKIVLGANRMMERELDEKAEVEARCCPEDYGFEEWVGVLEKRDNVVAHRHLQELVSLLLQARDPIGPMRDRGDYPVELQRAIDFLHGRGSPSATTERTDVERLNWLERKVVNVRRPALYGSWNEFWASPGDERNGEEEGAPSDLRKQIDTAMAADLAPADSGFNRG